MLTLKSTQKHISNVTHSPAARGGFRRKLDEQGFDHVVLAAVTVLVVGVIGTLAIVASHAATPASDTTTVPSGTVGDLFDGGGSGVNADASSKLFGGYESYVKDAFDSWVQIKIPTAATCKNTAGDQLSAWTGLQNNSSGRLEQAGVIMYCNSGSKTLHYNAFTEMAPEQNPVGYTMAVHPGDTITAEVSHNGGYQFIIKNKTTGGSVNHTYACPTNNTCAPAYGVWSAETLANSNYWVNGWGTIPFDGSVDDNSIGQFSHTHDSLVGLASTSALSEGGSHFSVNR